MATRKKAGATEARMERIAISPPNIQTAHFRLPGDEPLVVNRFGAKAKEAMQAAQEAGSTARSKKQRDKKDFEALFLQAQYRSAAGWAGIHAACIRNGCISACRTVGFTMTLMKLGLFVLADGYDRDDGTPLLRIWGPEPEMWIAPVRNADLSFDLRARPRWMDWEIRPRIRFDADMYTLQDVTNLVMRVGLQVGIGEGRPDSKKSAGIGYGLFHVARHDEEEKRNDV